MNNFFILYNHDADYPAEVIKRRAIYSESTVYEICTIAPNYITCQYKS